MESGGLLDEHRIHLGSAGPMSRPRYQGTMRETSDPLLGATVRNVRIDTGVTRQSLQAGTRSQAGSPIEVGLDRRTGIRDGEVHQRGDYRQGSVFPMTLVTGGVQRPTRGYSMPLAEPPPITSLGVKSVNQRYHATMLNRLMATICQALETPLRFPEGYKPNIRNDTIKKYDGSSKFSKLESWIAAVSY